MFRNVMCQGFNVKPKEKDIPAHITQIHHWRVSYRSNKSHCKIDTFPIGTHYVNPILLQRTSAPPQILEDLKSYIAET